MRFVFIRLSTIFAILILWWLLSLMIAPNLLPSPVLVWNAFVELLHEGYRDKSLAEHVAASLLRIFAAFFLALLTATPLGLWCGRNASMGAAVEPIIEFLKPLPPLGYYSLLILWLGIDEASKIMLIFLAAFIPIFIASRNASANVPSDYIKAALSVGASRFQVFVFVIIRASLPRVFVGWQIAFGASFSTLVAAEMVAADLGIGWLVLDSSKFMYTDIMFVGILLIGLLGISIDRILCAIKRKIVHWEEEQ